MDLSIYDMAHGAFEFRNAKLSADGRLSLHKELQVSKAPCIGGRAYDALAVRGWGELLARLRAGQLHPVRGAAAAEVFIEPASYGDLSLDEENARAVADVLDDAGGKLQLEVALRPENNFLVDNLERMLSKKGRKKNLPPDALFGRAWIDEGRLKFFPYTAVYNQAVVLKEHGVKRVNEVHLSLEGLDKIKGEK